MQPTLKCAATGKPHSRTSPAMQLSIASTPPLSPCLYGNPCRCMDKHTISLWSSDHICPWVISRDRLLAGTSLFIKDQSPPIHSSHCSKSVFFISRCSCCWPIFRHSLRLFPHRYKTREIPPQSSRSSIYVASWTITTADRVLETFNNSA